MAFATKGAKPQPFNPTSVYGTSALKGSIWYVSAYAGTKGGGRSWQSAYNTLTKALAVCAAGDTILLGPGSYDESPTILRTKQALTIIGVGNRGTVGISPQTAAAEGLLNHADDLTLVNVGVGAPTGGDYAMQSDGSRLRLYGCKLEGADTAGACLNLGPGTVAQRTAGTHGNAGDLLVDDCEFAWGYNGLRLVTSDYGTPTQVVVKDSWFHNLSNVCLLGVHAAYGIGSVRNLNLRDNAFDRLEDGTAPSDFININENISTGVCSGNRFAYATNASAVIVIGTKILWSANASEAGWSAARPA